MNWEIKTLDELGYIGRGRSRHRPRGDEKLYSGKYPFIQTGDVQKADFYITKYENTYSDFGFKQSKLWKKGTLCISIVGANTAESAILGIDACFPDSVIGFIADNNVSNTFFVKYYLDTIKVQMKTISEGAARENLSMDKLLSMKMLIPPLPTQTKIANILSAYDYLIENNNQRIKLLEEMAEEIYKEWFVRFRFPNYKNTKFIDKEGKEVKHGSLGALPEDWEEKRIKQIGKVITGKTPSKLIDENFDGQIPFIKTPDMQQGMFFVKTEETLSEQGANTQTSQYIPKNSISVSCIGTVGKIGITVEQSQTNQQINSIIPLFNLSLEYIFFSIKRIKPIIESYAATGATMANLSKTKFENLKIIYPSKDLLTLFHKSANPIFEEIKILMQKNQTLQETRNLLLPRLISGKLSVEEIELGIEN